MLSRRILAGACALALFVPAAASAMPPHDLPAAYGGSTIAGDTKSDLHARQSYADQVASLPAKQLAAAYGTQTGAKPIAASRGPIVSSDDGTNGWRVAAVVEAAVLAAFAAGAAFLIASRRRRAPGMGV